MDEISQKTTYITKTLCHFNCVVKLEVNLTIVHKNTLNTY